MPVVARVLTDVTGIDKTFDYEVPDALVSAIAPGKRVRIDLNSRRVGGWVLEVTSIPSAQVDRSLSPIVTVSGDGVEPHLVPLCEWVATNWCGPLRAVMASASAPRVSNIRSTPHHGRGPVKVADEVAIAARTLLRSGGGALVVPPLLSALSVVSACAEEGTVLVACPTKRMVSLGAALLRKRGLVVAAVPDDWSRAAGGVDVVIGTRSAVWAPCASLAAIVVIDSHDDSFFEERAPTWNAVDVARERARRAEVPFIETTPAPRLSTLVKARDVVMVEDSDGGGRQPWPLVVVEDLLELPVKGSLVGTRLIDALRGAGSSVVSILNVKGRARLTACAHCGAISRCATCSVPMSLGDDSNFACNVCDITQPALCGECGRTKFKLLRRGVSQVERELTAAASRRVVNVEQDTPLEMLDSATCYVGTESVLHRISSADVVCLMDIDDDLMSQRLSAVNDALALIVRSARVVGRGGRLIIQTREPNHPLMRVFASNEPVAYQTNLVEVLRAEVEKRRQMGLPPLREMAVVAGLSETPTPVLGVSLARRPDSSFAIMGDSREQLIDYIAGLRTKNAKLRAYVDPSRV